MRQRALSLGIVLLLAKAILLALRAADGARLGPLGVLAVFREEPVVWAVIVLLDLASSRLVSRRGARWRRGREGVAWAVYAVVGGYAALHVPMARVLGTPPTSAMVEAAGSELGDSIRAYATPVNVAAVVLLAGLLVLLPRYGALGRVRVLPLAIGAALLAVAGAWAGTRADTLGLHRDPCVALARTAWIRSSFARTRVRGSEARHEGAVTEIVPSGRALDLEHLSGAARGRHVLWIILESTGARYLAPYGAKDDPMPNLTRLAASGLVFEDAHAAYPESIKGLHSMLCSTHPVPHTRASDYAARNRPCTSLAEVFARAGYGTALYHSGHFAYLGMHDIVRDRGFGTLADAMTIRGKHFSSFGTDDRSTADAVLARFDARKPGEKLFVTYMPISGHHPYETPGEGPRPFGEATDLERYKSDLFRGDLALGALVRGLEDRGVWEDTLVVIHGDHGEAFLQHPGNFAHTMYAYEENMHVPLVVVLPGITTSAVRAPQVASLVDVAPTIAALAGLDAPAGWQGTSLLAGTPHVVRFFADQSSELLALRDGRWKLIADEDSGKATLFDLTQDPGEARDVSGEDPARVLLYTEDLRAWRARGRRAALSLRR